MILHRTSKWANGPYLPSVALEERKLRLPFLNQCVARSLPSSELATWLIGPFVYYRPDSDRDLVLVTFGKSDAELYTHEEVDAWWKEIQREFGLLGSFNLAVAPTFANLQRCRN